jgi:hypothetical protein
VCGEQCVAQHRLLKRHGLVRPEPRKRPKSSYRRFAYARPRDCHQIDATEVKLAGGATAVVFEVLDDCTRLLVATLAWEVENAAGAIAAITRAFDRFGVPALVLAMGRFYVPSSGGGQRLKLEDQARRRAQGARRRWWPLD